MKAKNALYGAVLVVLTVVGSARAEDLRAVMEANNARWLAAYNTNTPVAFPAMYTKDAVVLPPGSQPVSGRQAIGQFWEDRLKPGNRKDHTFEIISLQQDGQYAYQVARWTLNIIVKTGEPMKVSVTPSASSSTSPTGLGSPRCTSSTFTNDCRGDQHVADAKTPKVVIDARLQTPQATGGSFYFHRSHRRGPAGRRWCCDCRASRRRASLC